MDVSLEGKAALVTGAVNVAAAGNFLNTKLAAIAMIRVNSFSPTAPDPDNPEPVAELEDKGPFHRPRHDGGRPEWWRDIGSFDVRGNIPMGAASTPTDIGHLTSLSEAQQ